MSVYVDTLLRWDKRPGWRWDFACHMYADSDDELHAFAKRIGLKREWHQNDTRLSHYDLNPSRRQAAVKAGAIETDRRHLVSYTAAAAKAREGLMSDNEYPAIIDELERRVESLNRELRTLRAQPTTDELLRSLIDDGSSCVRILKGWVAVYSSRLMSVSEEAVPIVNHDIRAALAEVVKRLVPVKQESGSDGRSMA